LSWTPISHLKGWPRPYYYSAANTPFHTHMGTDLGVGWFGCDSDNICDGSHKNKRSKLMSVYFSLFPSCTYSWFKPKSIKNYEIMITFLSTWSRKFCISFLQEGVSTKYSF
jgi:hypothetical protein